MLIISKMADENYLFVKLFTTIRCDVYLVATIRADKLMMFFAIFCSVSIISLTAINAK